MAAAATETPSSHIAASAMITAGNTVPGPRTTATKPRRSRTSRRFTVTASEKSTSARPRVASTRSSGDWS
jgi:hypothetical protein